MPPLLERELANITSELAKQDELVAAKQKEIAVVNARYDADKKRWKELRVASEAQMNGGKAPPAASTTSAPTTTTSTSATAQK